MSGGDAFRCVVVSDFNVETLNRLLANDESAPRVQPVEAPYGQVHQLLAGSHAAAWRESPDVVLAWTRPEAQLPSFARLLGGEHIEPADLTQDVDDFVERLAAVKGRARFVFAATWAHEPTRAFALLGGSPGAGVQHALIAANLRLIERLAAYPGVHALDASSWFTGASPYSAKLWHLSKNPYAPTVHRAAMGALKSALRTLTGRSRKLIVLDLDDTLWGGILGEVGWQNLRLGGHDPIGEAFVDFQATLKSFVRRGVVLAVASRNDEAPALSAIAEHPEMVLRVADFAAWRIDWKDKAANVADLAESLNLGLDAVVFIDDDPVQRARVRGALPDVLVPEWPSDPMLYSRALLDLDCFDSVGLSAEDRRRGEMYAADRRRTESRAGASLEDWLRTLDIVCTCEPLGESNLTRAAQLLNKTNQLNLTTRRLSEAELRDWAADPEHSVLTFRVADRYGDLGLTGLLGIETQGDAATVVDFLLSCRAMGRRIEETMAAVAVAVARLNDAATVTARFIATGRNRPCLDFWQNSGWSRIDDTAFQWRTSEPYPIPDAVRLVGFDPSASAGDRSGWSRRRHATRVHLP